MLNALARYDLRTARFVAQKLSASGVEIHRSIALEGATQRALRAGLLLDWLRGCDVPPTLGDIERAGSSILRLDARRQTITAD